MNKINAEKLYDMAWSLKRAEIAAKSQWDEVVKFKGELIYELRYEDVKEYRAAYKFAQELREQLVNNGLMDYTSLDEKANKA